MDLVASCKDKLQYFRIKELKDVLTQLGLSKQGKKQDLVQRILATVSDEQVSKIWPKKNAIGKEQVVKLVDDTYRRLQVSGAIDLASKSSGASDSSNVKIERKINDPYQSDMKIRCLCGSSLETESMIKCEDPRCYVWQHISCVIIPEKRTESNIPVPELFYCEICRLNRADPFWGTVAHPLYPVKLMATNIPTDGTNPVQTVEKIFQLTRADKDLLSKQEYDVQVWCMLLNDKVLFRMHWPQYADLQVNDMPVRAINRPGSQLLGVNGRDDGSIITPYTKDGINKISLTGCDARIFCLGIRIVKRRTVQQILSLIPKESDGEPLEDALARICRCVGGGATDNADSDSDLEVVADAFTVNLRCPMSGSRMKVAGRFKPCVHVGCFDIEVFVELNKRSRKWQCPTCLKNYALENIIIDPYFNRIASLMKHCGEDATEIEVKPDGSWRVRVKSESERRDLGSLGQWHSPEGNLCVPTDEEKPKTEALKQVRQEVFSEGHTGLKLGIRKNSNGFWEVSKPEGMNNSSGIRLQENLESFDQKVLPMSSSATESGRDGDDPSVNQDGIGNFDFSTNNGVKMDFISLNVNSAHEIADQNPTAPIGNAEVIVLSDSDDDNEMFVSSASACKNHQKDGVDVSFSVPPPVITDSYTEDPALETVGTSCLGLLDASDEFEMPLWHIPSGNQPGPGFQLFGSDADVQDALVDLPHCSIGCSTSINGYTLAPETSMGSAALVPNNSIGCHDTDMSDGLVDNPLAFAGDDPSLQIFLPTRPSDVSMQSDFRDQADMSNGVRNEDWISLRLGGGASGGIGESATPNGMASKQQASSRESTMDTLANSASLLLGMSDGRSDKASRQRSDSPFSFPRQKRLYLSIDSDSE